MSEPAPKAPESREDTVLRITAELARELSSASEMAEPTLHTTFDHDLGFDSLTRVELVARVERELDVRLGDDVL